jgi:putative NADH-flavin reductase
MKKKIVIIGSSGSTGKELLKLALNAGYDVTVIVRNPDSVMSNKNLKAIKGDVLNLESLNNSLEKADVVISCLGPTKNLKAGNLMSQGTKNIIKSCEKNSVNKVIMMSGILQSDGKELSFLNRNALKLVRIFLSDIYKDKIIAETAVQKSSLDWVIVRSVGLTNNQSDSYNAGPNIKVAPFSPLSYAQCATCLLDAIENLTWSRKIINVGTKK